MKKERLLRIKELVEQRDITTQEMLVDLLNSDGYNVTQATVSRDIKKLGLVKSFDNGVNKYVLKQHGNVDEHRVMFNNSVLDVATAQNIVVIKCRTGMANAICVYIDELDLTGIVGTLAGDDTIFIAALDNNSADMIRNTIISQAQ